jgi:DNA-binding GntR family transcriptional regulator
MEKVYLKTQGAGNKVNVYRTLKNAIQFLELKPGATISETSLIKELGVSRTPIREALIRLSDDLLINTYPQRGTYVARIDLSLVKEMAYMRHVIEEDICLKLCKKKADISSRAAESLFFMEQAVKNKDVIKYILNDNKFHRAIFSAADHEMVWSVILNSRVHYIRFLMLDMTLPNMLENSYQEHKNIVKYIGDGNQKELMKILETHHDHNKTTREEEIKEKYNEYFI